MSTNEPGAPVPLHLQVRAARLNAKLTMGELARLAGVNRTWLQKFENGGKNITVESLGRIMAQLPNAHFAVPGGASISSAGADSAEMAAHMRELIRLTDEHAAHIHAAVDALTAMAESAAAIAGHAARMQQLWGKAHVGADAAEAPAEDHSEGETSAGQPLPVELQPRPEPVPLDEPLIRKRVLRLTRPFRRLFRPLPGDDE
ncbi:MAG TPA: helix-turn-helix transcriptional regulator [Thermoanaerobaculia bacterium]|nr:helix-turn-helix transcriptional regulator [Thermoanaerobaculia bacterium]